MSRAHADPESTTPGTATCGLAAHAAVRLSVEEAQALRKAPLRGCGDVFSVSSLKHFDEQTLAVLAALKLLLGDAAQEAAGAFHGWGVLAAPRYLGRAMMGPSIARFHEEGAWGVSPHLVPHRSLHAISGTVSQFLKAHGPNFGVGGGPGCVAEALLAASAVLQGMRPPGVWLVLSRVEPEMHLGDGGRPHRDALCEAVVLALVPAGSPARALLEVTAGAPGKGIEPIDFDALARLDEALARRGPVAYTLGDFGQVSVRQTQEHLNGSLSSYLPPLALAAG